MQLNENRKYWQHKNYKSAWYETGRCEPLLFVHGITAYAFIWEKMLPYLESSYSLILIDLSGCGYSGKTLSEGYSLKRYAEILHKFCLEKAPKLTDIIHRFISTNI